MTWRNYSTKTGSSGFTLVELLVAMAVLALLVLVVNQLFSSATRVTTLGNKRMDAQGQARPLFDRMQLDLAQMIKRADVDYYLKDSTNRSRGTIN